MGARTSPLPQAPIQVVPPGLLSLLQLKSLGSAPQNLANDVQCVIEMRDWYFTARRVDAAINLFANGTPQTAVLVNGAIGVQSFTIAGANAAVPNNEIWYVEEYSATGPTALAADVLSFSMALLNQQNTTVIPVGPRSVDVVTARNRVVSAKADRGFWALSGDRFAVLVEDIATAGITLTMAMRATRLQVP